MRMRWMLLNSTAAALAASLPAPLAAAAKPPAKAPTIEALVAQARGDAIARFRDIRKPSQWAEMLARRLGPLKLVKAPAVDAARQVAAKLGLALEAAPGVEGTVTYDKDGSLGDFVRDGLNPRYWYLSEEGGKLRLAPHTALAVAAVPAERGLYYSDHEQELAAIAARCGAMGEYNESLHIDAAGAVTLRGRVCFIERVKAALGIEE